MSQDSLLSHFQIGGIHGRPYKKWNESGGDSKVGDFGGYCTHGSVLFPTWHRPYVALYEVCTLYFLRILPVACC